MKTKLFKKDGVTLVEVCISIVVLACVMNVIMSFMAGGIKGSNKGVSHLTIMRGAENFIAYLEKDLQKASKIIDPIAGEVDKALRIETVNDKGKTSIVTYDCFPNGINRKVYNGVSTISDNMLCKDQTVKIKFFHLEFAQKDSYQNTKAVMVQLEVSSAKDSAEKINLERFFTCRSL